MILFNYSVHIKVVVNVFLSQTSSLYIFRSFLVRPSGKNTKSNSSMMIRERKSKLRSNFFPLNHFTLSTVLNSATFNASDPGINFHCLLLASPSYPTLTTLPQNLQTIFLPPSNPPIVRLVCFANQLPFQLKFFEIDPISFALFPL